MAGDPRVYSEEEVALILRRATASSGSSSAEVGSPGGLTLEQIVGIAEEVGIDPTDVRRAARLVPRGDHESLLARIVGGASRHERVAQVQTELTEEGAARVLSSVRAVADHPGEGQGDAFGISWQSWKGRDRVTVSVVPRETGTSIRIRIDRTRSLLHGVLWSQFAVVMSIWMLIENVDSYAGLVALGELVGRVLGIDQRLSARVRLLA